MQILPLLHPIGWAFKIEFPLGTAVNILYLVIKIDQPCF